MEQKWVLWLLMRDLSMNLVKVRLERPLYFNYSKGSPFPSGNLWLHHSLSSWHWRSWVIYWQWQFSELWRYPAEENRNINLGLKTHEQIGSWNSSKPSSSNTYMFISYLNIYFICVVMFNLIYYRTKQTKRRSYLILHGCSFCMLGFHLD